ncbi:hypothetical protein JCM5350_004011 [Sporobolomyces pararoseus]
MSEVPQAQETPSEASTRVSKRSISDALASLDQACRDSISTLSNTKKRRTAAPPSSTPALEAILARNTARSSPSSAPPPPSYEPTSLPALLSRLSTYKLTTYSPSKPPSLSSLNCALHGWINKSSRERLECVTCHKGVVLLPPTSGGWHSPAGQSLREEYERLVGDNGGGHDTTCPWRMRPCSRGLYRLQGGGLGVQQGGRRKLLEIVGKQAREMETRGLSAVQLEVPEKVKELLEETGAKEKLLKSVVSLLPPPSSSPNDIPSEGTSSVLSTTTLLLAIFGWSLDPLPYSNLSRSASNSSISSLNSLSSSSASSPSTTPILTCSYCLRQVLTSSYLPSPSTTTTSSTTPKLFNPATQHHSYCPYIDTSTILNSSSASIQRTPTTTNKKKPGYLIRLESILQKPSVSSLTNSFSTSPANDASNGNIRGEGVVGNEDSRKLNSVKTKELLNYVRGLLGPKVATSTKSTRTA